MPFKLRLEYPGAIYHVINRGNYRRWIFAEDGAKAAFESCLFAACQRCEWLLDAFVIMGNHFHLALETPRGNLVAGMQWLESTYANRFNRFRGEKGHLFQGRYKALLVEPGDALGQLGCYLDLNPVRAGMASVERLADYRYSSYWYGLHPWKRPKELACATVLETLGLSDSRAGWESYRDYLAWQATDGPAGKNAAYVSLTTGWALGSDEFKEMLLRDCKLAADARAWESEGAQAVRERKWAEHLRQARDVLPVRSRQSQSKSAPWKVVLAAHLKATTDVSNSWLAAQLDMGSPFYVSKHVGLLRREIHVSQGRQLLQLLEVKGKA